MTIDSRTGSPLGPVNGTVRAPVLFPSGLPIASGVARFYKVSSMGFVATASAMAILGPEAITPWALAIPAS